MAFKNSAYYQNYLLQLSDSKTKQKASPVEVLNELMQTGDKALPAMERAKKIFELSKMMDDLTNVDEIIEFGAVNVLPNWLNDDNSQFRKYTASVLAGCAASVKGQLAILNTANVLEGKIIKILDVCV